MEASAEDYTHHARMRCQQRGVSHQDLTILYEFGKSIYHGGREIICFDKGGWDRFLKKNDQLDPKRKIPKQRLDRLRGKYLLDEGGKIITTGHRFKKVAFRQCKKSKGRKKGIFYGSNN